MRKPVEITPLKLAERFLGVAEVVGAVHNPLVVAMLALENPGIKDDETPWCSAFVNFIFWLLGLPRSRSLAARSWLKVGTPVPVTAAVPGFAVVILKRGAGKQPGPEVLAAPGHVGLFAGYEDGWVSVLGGNQGNRVSVARFPVEQVLGIREV